MIQAFSDFQLNQTLNTWALFKKIVLPIYTRILTFHYLNGDFRVHATTQTWWLTGACTQEDEAGRLLRTLLWDSVLKISNRKKPHPHKSAFYFLICDNFIQRKHRHNAYAFLVVQNWIFTALPWISRTGNFICPLTLKFVFASQQCCFLNKSHRRLRKLILPWQKAHEDQHRSRGCFRPPASEVFISWHHCFWAACRVCAAAE